jgi:hypothetical protein
MSTLKFRKGATKSFVSHSWEIRARMTSDGWKPAVRFNHDLFGFNLVASIKGDEVQMVSVVVFTKAGISPPVFVLSIFTVISKWLAY